MRSWSRFQRGGGRSDCERESAAVRVEKSRGRVARRMGGLRGCMLGLEGVGCDGMGWWMGWWMGVVRYLLCCMYLLCIDEGA